MELYIVFGTLILALILFVWGKFRHDLVAVFCLLILTICKIIPFEEAFLGFAHPAVITVAVILVVSKALQDSGLIEILGQKVIQLGNNLTLQISLLSIIVCVASAFMNNVGALAIMMPVAIHIAQKSGHSPSSILMPISFASLLGGMTTLIGTPPNIIIASFRANEVGESFSMFDFAPVGLSLSVLGLLFIIFIGWRILPKRVSSEEGANMFNIEDYITEIEIDEDSKLVDKPLYELTKIIDGDIQILSVVRNKYLMHAPDIRMKIKTGDIISIESDAEDLKAFLEKSNSKLIAKKEDLPEIIGGEEISNVEAVVMADAPIINQTAVGLNMRNRYGVNLLAISRQNKKIRKRLDHVKFKVGDVLLLQGGALKMGEILQNIGCLPLADRGFELGKPRKLILALSIFLMSIGIIILDWLPVQIAFTLAALALVVTKTINIKDLYNSIDWPVIVLLGAMLPVGTALEKSGGAELIASYILNLGNSYPAAAILSVIFVITMLLSNVINNAATVVLMAPIGLGIAHGLGTSSDPFLMAIAVASSAAFLTPIGHQSNTLVMGPGGYMFKDYFKFGLPVSILVTVIGIPLIIYFWPF
ncbi:SLC13 family permease [Fontibacter flavus]|uniref:SLC13 family permease n=1 Tax=Fontibacter flavus TaxID=654838 RepID=A0ABV6FY17_9BACT